MLSDTCIKHFSHPPDQIIADLGPLPGARTSLRASLGLAYTVGGRSLFFGGWSPQLLDEGITQWTAHVVTALKQGIFRRGSEADRRRRIQRLHAWQAARCFALRKLLAEP